MNALLIKITDTGQICIQNLMSLYVLLKSLRKVDYWGHKYAIFYCYKGYSPLEATIHHFLPSMPSCPLIRC